MIKEYIAYIKNNPQGYWFKRKLYGWGWTPAKWQGWATIAIYVIALISVFRGFDETVYSEEQAVIRFLVPTIIITLILILVCYLKGEKPKWTWGIPKEEDVDSNR